MKYCLLEETFYLLKSLNYMCPLDYHRKAQFPRVLDLGVNDELDCTGRRQRGALGEG